MDQPEKDLAECFAYLDMLRESGATNMYGAGAYLERDMGLERKDARSVLAMWMQSFNDVSPEERARIALAKPA